MKSMSHHFGVILFVAATFAVNDRTSAEELDMVDQGDQWTNVSTATGRFNKTAREIHSAELTDRASHLTLIPMDAEMRDDNSAIWYLRAVSFLEQDAARRSIETFIADQNENKDYDDWIPYRWLNQRPSELAIDQVRQYLQFYSFQELELEKANHCRRFDMQRNARSIDRPVDYLMPELRTFSDTIHRVQRVRLRLAVAEGRIDDAIRILGQQLHLSRHLSQDPFLVSTLYSTRLLRTTFEDALHLLTHPACPNLYDALGRLPEPLIDTSSAIPFEQDLLYLQVPTLAVLKENPNGIHDWSQFFRQTIDRLDEDTKLSKVLRDQGLVGAGMYVAAADNQSRTFLNKYMQRSVAEIEAMSPVQRFFTAACGMYDRLTMMHLRMLRSNSMVTPHLADELSEFRRNYSALVNTIGWAILNIEQAVLRPGTQSAGLLAMLQTIEALRHHLATHEGQWPATLDEMELPAPNDSVLRQPIKYQVDSDQVTLSTQSSGADWVEVTLTVAAQTSTEKTLAEHPINSEVINPVGQYSVGELDLTALDETNWWKNQSTADKNTLLASVRRLKLAVSSQSTSDAIGGFEIELKDVPMISHSQLSPSALALTRTAGETVKEQPFWVTVAIPGTLLEVFRQIGSDEQTKDSDLVSLLSCLRSLAIGFHPEKGSLKCVIQCCDDEHAKRLPDLLSSLVKELKSLPIQVESSRVILRIDVSEIDPALTKTALSALADAIAKANDAEIRWRFQKLILAVHNYHSAFRMLPPHRPAKYNLNGTGLSWRVHLLPFIGDSEYVELFEQFHLNEAWDSPHNRPLVEKMPAIFAPIDRGLGEADMPPGYTTIVVPASEDQGWGTAELTRFRQFNDGLSQTIFVVEVRPDRAVPWTAPQDYPYDPANPEAGLAKNRGRMTVAFGDGVARTIPADQNPALLKGLFTRAGFEDLREWWKDHPDD